MTRGALAGRSIILPESRELDLFSSLLARYEADVIRCPLITVTELSDHTVVDAWLDRLVAAPHDLLAFYTGEGVTRLADRADHLGRRQEVIEAMSCATKITRGPKPGAALRKLGLRSDVMTPQPTTDGLLDLLGTMDLRRRRVGVQLYPAAPQERLCEAIAGYGGSWDPVIPYAYVSDEADDQVAGAIERMANGEIDLIAFTSKLQVQRLSRLAAKRRITGQLKRGLVKTTVAAVGPITAQAVMEAGGTVRIQPESSFHLKPLVAEIVRQFGGD